MDEKEILIRQLNREKNARHVAEKILEEKSLELYKLNSELRETIQSLSEHENRILSILNVSEDGILVFDRSLQIKTANISACSILGYNESQLLGSSIELLFPHDDFKMILNTMLEGKIEKAPIRRPFKIQGITKANKIIPIEMSLSLYDHTEESNILCIFHNSHKKKQTEIYFEIKRQIPKILDENIPFEDVFKNILQLLITHLHLDVGLAWLVNTENISSYQCSYTQDPFSFNDFINESKKIKFAPGLGLPGRTVQSKQIEWIENIHTDENFHRTEIIKNIPLSCGFAFPVFFENTPVAIFELFKHSDYVFDENLNILLREVSFQTSNFIEKRRTYQKLNAAKASGMSEVANSVLHNVGNVLNSLNISSNILIDFFGQSKLNGLLKLKSLLKDNHHELSQLLSHNKLSQGLKEYILKLADLWEFEKVEYYNEAISLNRHVEHIKAIINSQQSISGSSSMSEPVLIEQLMEDAIAIHFFTFQKYNINVIQKYNASFPVLIDKIKVSQILINFIKNAFVALLERSTDEKKIILDIEHIDQKIRIYVSDNGIGIEPDTMDKIFTSGFTTKSKGYGFGLHSCLIAAKELGGSIEVLSGGKNKGATFILEFPFKKIPINPIL